MSTIIRKHINISLLLATLAFSQLLCSCYQGSYSDCPIIDDPISATTYISFSITTLDASEDTRSNPTGGEDGDGREVGINNENNIYDVTLFLFESNSNNAINSLENPTVISLYINQFRYEGNAGNNYTYHTYPIEVEKTSVSANTRVIAVANAGDLSVKNINTLDGLRNYVYTDAVLKTNSNIANYNRFVMSSTSLSTFIVEKDGKELGTYEDPATTTVTIQRMASRIDIVPQKALTNGYYEYGIFDSNDKVRITHITAFNCWKPQSGQYLLKRVSTDGTESNKSILGLETPQAGVQTNYVLSLQMNNKTSNYWVSNPSIIKQWYRNHVTDAITPQTVIAPTNTDEDSKSYYILDYTQENTMQIEGQLNCYTTGILAQATYVPEKVYTADGETLAAYTVGSNLWLLDDKFYAEPISGAILYTNGTCYYRYYIRHSNNGILGSMGIMEFGIVRNNIYRLAIDGMGEIGSPDPEPEDPKDLDEFLRIRIEVKKWAQRTHQQIIM